jgi:hypothetical protein
MAIYPTGAGLSIALRATNSTKSAAQWSRGVEPTDIITHWILDASPFITPPPSPNNNAAELWGYSLAQRVDGYSGDPARIIRLPNPAYAGRGHNLIILENGDMVVATSEPSGGNGNESWFLIGAGAIGSLSQAQCPRIRCNQLFAGTPNETGGARGCSDMGDGNILLGTNGAWKMVTRDAWSMTDEQLAAIPYWRYSGNGSISGILEWDLQRIPGTQVVRFNGEDRFFDIDFSVPHGPIDGTTVPGGDGLTRIALGSNIGQIGWYGHIAIDALGGTWKQRGFVPDIAYWSAETIASLPKLGNQAGANPAPDKTLTWPQLSELGEHEDIFCGLDLLADGSMLVTSHNSNRYANAQVVSARKWWFSAAKVAAGGEQEPDVTVTLPSWSQPWILRCTPDFRLHPR